MDFKSCLFSFSITEPVNGTERFFAQGTVACLGTFSLWTSLFYIFVRTLGTASSGVLSFLALVVSDMTMVSEHSVVRIYSFITESVDELVAPVHLATTVDDVEIALIPRSLPLD